MCFYMYIGRGQVWLYGGVTLRSSLAATSCTATTPLLRGRSIGCVLSRTTAGHKTNLYCKGAEGRV